MTKHDISQEDVITLRGNPYVSTVSARQINFTVEFKQRFFNEFQSGKSPSKILRDMGINPDMLGTSRVYGIRQHVMEQIKRGCGFTDRKENKFSDMDVMRARTSEEKIARLEHALAYTQQELEYIKKIIFADREARREWEAKQAPMSNSESSEK